MAKPNSTFKDMHRETYLRSLFGNCNLMAKQVAYPERAETIMNYILSNPSNADEKIDRNGMVIKNGHFFIKKSGFLKA